MKTKYSKKTELEKLQSFIKNVAPPFFNKLTINIDSVNEFRDYVDPFGFFEICADELKLKYKHIALYLAFQIQDPKKFFFGYHVNDIFINEDDEAVDINNRTQKLSAQEIDGALRTVYDIFNDEVKMSFITEPFSNEGTQNVQKEIDSHASFAL